jgi:hypothetical protein
MNYAIVRSLVVIGGIGLCLFAADEAKKNYRTAPVGYNDTPQIPGQKWRVHDIDRPAPKVVTPGKLPGQPPSDAIVLFDGKDLSKWVEKQKGVIHDPPRWKITNGYMEVSGNTGSIETKEKFGNIQLHVEYATPTVIDGDSQWRGNSGIVIMSRYEIQVLDSYNNRTYADGQAGAIYGQWPPLVNASRPPGEWQTYDIVFEAPKFEGGKLSQHAYATVFHNGVLLHNRQRVEGQMAHRIYKPYEVHGPEESLQLQNHDTPVRYRNIWVRRLKGYDQP